MHCGHRRVPNDSRNFAEATYLVDFPFQECVPDLGLGGSRSNLTTQILNKELHSRSVSNGLYELSCINEATELARPRWSGRWNRASRVARKHIFTTSKPGILRLLYIELFMTLKSSCNLPSESDFSILYKCIHSNPALHQIFLTCRFAPIISYF